LAAEFKYWAFISYSHQDNRTSGNAWGDWLHDPIETFKVPPELTGTVGRYGELIPGRLFPAFQDEKELPTNADLGTAIQAALKQSRYLVVICSPRSAKSVYVNQEVLEFKRLGRTNRILAIIIDGEPNASERAKGFDPALECFPEGLRHPLKPDGTLDLSLRAEPIAADVRASGGVEASLKDKSQQQTLEREKLRVMAGLLGIGFDDLVQRDKERQLREERARARRLRKLVAGFATLALVATLAGIFAIVQKHEAEAQRQQAETHRQEAVAQKQEAQSQQHEAILQKSEAEKQRSVAVTEKQEVEHQQHEVELSFSKADLVAALERVSVYQDAEGVAYLCRALRTNPENRDAAALLFSVLRNRNWVVPLDRFQLDQKESFLAFDGDGRLSLTVKDGKGRVWDDARHGVIREIPGMKFGGVAPFFSPDGRHLFLSGSNSMENLDLVTGRQSQTGSKREEFDWFSQEFRFSPDGTQMALGSDGKLQSWDLTTNQPVGSSVSRPANSYDGIPTALSGDGSRMLAGGGATILWAGGGIVTRRFENGNLRVWDLANNKPLLDLGFRDTQVKRAAFSPDGQNVVAATLEDRPTAATANSYNTLRIWNVSKAKLISIPLGSGIESTSWSADSRYVLSTTENILRVWDAATGEPEAAGLHLPDRAIDAWFSPDGKRIIAVVIQTSGVDLSSEAGLRMYALNPRGSVVESFYEPKMVMTWDASPASSAVDTWKQGPWVLDAKFSPDGHWIVTTSGNAAQIWDARTHALNRSLPMDGVPVCAVFSPDSRRLLLVSNNQTAQVWDVASGRAIAGPIRDEAEMEYAEQHNNQGVSSIGFAGPAHPARRFTGDFSPDGKYVAVATGFSARIWDAATGRAVMGPLRHRGFVNSVSFSRDGRSLLTWSSLDATARLWDVPTGHATGVAFHPNGRIIMATLSPNREYIATSAYDHTVQTWNARTGKQVSTIKQAEQTTFVEFSPDSKRLVTVSGNAARVWNAASGKSISAPMSHSALLASAAFSPDGNFVITASEDHTVGIFSAATGLKVSAPISFGNKVNVASFSADGRYVIAAGEDGSVKTWPFSSALPASWILDFAESLAGCTLDAAGNPSYVPGKTRAWLRERAKQEGSKTDPLSVWARKILGVD
jgi:WD40 repeat protein